MGFISRSHESSVGNRTSIGLGAFGKFLNFFFSEVEKSILISKISKIENQFQIQKFQILHLIKTFEYIKKKNL